MIQSFDVLASEYRLLGGLACRRGWFRTCRTVSRLRSPRRLAATSLAVGCFAIYLLNGVLILANRAPADPERLRLWLSGGMVIYAFYHSLRCGWSALLDDLELTPAELLWLVGAPLRRSSLAIYQLGNVAFASLVKTILITVLLARDVAHWGWLVAGIFTALVMLDTTRLIIGRVVSGLDSKQRQVWKTGSALIIVAVGLQVLARLMEQTPVGAPTWRYVFNAFACLGQTAASDLIQWLSLPWWPAAGLAVQGGWDLVTLANLLAAVGLCAFAVMILVATDARALRSAHSLERQRLTDGHFDRIKPTKANARPALATSRESRIVAPRAPAPLHDVNVLVQRQWLSVKRYAGTILFSFLVPALLSLSPLLTGQVRQQWLFVVGGLALCTMLLAPPALRLDFRRDLKRMLLLRSLPVDGVSLVVGQLLLPVLITIAFQLVTIVIAAAVTRPGMGQIVLWSGLLAALAVFVFAIENALFLAYPHHERAQGFGMLIRAKLTFLGKAIVIAGCLLSLFVWARVCQTQLPSVIATPAYVLGAIGCGWVLAAGSLLLTVYCWHNFDLASDLPPE